MPELDVDTLGPLFLGRYEKTLFSMATPEVVALLKNRDLKSVVLFGIEVGDVSAGPYRCNPSRYCL